MLKNFVIWLIIFLLGFITAQVLYFYHSDQSAIKLPIDSFAPESKIEPAVFVPAPAVSQLVQDYLQKNLSALSPEPEVLGGKFYLTKIVFQDNQTAVIDYEDGHNAFRAELKFSISPYEEVAIESFRSLKN